MTVFIARYSILSYFKKSIYQRKYQKHVFHLLSDELYIMILNHFYMAMIIIITQLRACEETRACHSKEIGTALPYMFKT